jgi:hypothetical protein
LCREDPSTVDHQESPARRCHGEATFLIHLYAVAAIWCATVAAALVAGRVFGWSSGIYCIGAVASLCGLAKGLVEVFVLFEKQGGEEGSIRSVWMGKRAGLVIGASVLLTTTAVAVLMTRKLIDGWQKPSASLAIPEKVEMVQSAVVEWRNIPDAADVRVLVRVRNMPGDFIEPCRGEGSPQGTMSCELVIGGNDDAGTKFEVRVVVIARRLSAGFAALTAEPFSLPNTLEEMQVMDFATVTRK